MKAIEQLIQAGMESTPMVAVTARAAKDELADLLAVVEAANDLVFHGDSRKPQWETLAAALAKVTK